MKRSDKPQSATSLDVAPEDDSRVRMRNYLVTMGIRTACLILLAVWQPYGWQTAILAVGAIFLPYIAVVMANAGSGKEVTKAVAPQKQAIAEPAPQDDEETRPSVIRLRESPSEEADRDSDTPGDASGARERDAP